MTEHIAYAGRGPDRTIHVTTELRLPTGDIEGATVCLPPEEAIQLAREILRFAAEAVRPCD